ncbi:suppressor of cytokine signaling 3a [Hemibagrus wyckioides]|nr:suppressor of cytokine signaling 3a [Hemibagrus wyckioides]
MVRPSKQLNGFVPALNGYQLNAHTYRTFRSKAEYQLVHGAWCRLQECGFYWASISGKEAGILLEQEAIGTFLIRDSQDRRHFFTLSVKTSSGTKNVRIQCDNRSFFLQTAPEYEWIAPRFDCVVKLANHYVNSQKEPKDNSQNFFIYSGGEKIPLELCKPYYKAMSSLQHLCRKTVNGHTKILGRRHELPKPINDFLSLYDSPI